MLLQYERLKRLSAHRLRLETTTPRLLGTLSGRKRWRDIRLLILEPQLSLKGHDTLPRDEQAAPVAGLGGRREVAVAEDACAFLGDGPRCCRLLQ